MTPRLNQRTSKKGPTVSKLLKCKKDTVKRAIHNIFRRTRASLLDFPISYPTLGLLRECKETDVPPPVRLRILIEKSRAFELKFPVNTVCNSELRKRISKKTLENHANSAYPLIHEDMLPLIADWLEHKREHGSAVEKSLYENMGLIDLVQRLLERRAFCFLGKKDKYKIDGVKLGFGRWEDVGTNREKPPLVLKDCLSYDEIKLSAMLTMSSHTEFINDGSRNNNGVVVTDSDKLEPRGVIIGVVGSRFQRPGFMEYQDIVVAPDQNTAENGYGQAQVSWGIRKVWARFYGESHLPLYEEVAERLQKDPLDSRYVPVEQGYIFDVENYLKRTLITAEIILLEANARAFELQTTAYLHVVGFGLGVWKALPEQEIYFIEAFEIALKRTMDKIPHVSDIMFAYLKNETSCGGVEDGGLLGHVKIHFGKREPHSALKDDKLLVVTYACDGNALPGNDFWMGRLALSGDSAAACSTQIAELHNVHINPRASAANLHIASPEHGILHIANYTKRKLYY